MSNFHSRSARESYANRYATDVVNSSTFDDALARRLLLAVVVLALLLRILFLGKSLWLDEGIAVGNAWAGALPLSSWSKWFADLWSRSEFNMVFYFAVLRVWLRAGNSEAFIRLLSVIPAIATLPVLYGIGRRLFSERVALTATLLLAVHGAHVSYSQEARGYTMAVFFAAACTFFFIRGVQNDSWANWVLYALTAALGTYCHLFVILVVGSHWFSQAVVRRREMPWGKMGAGSAILLIAVIPALWFAASNRGHQVEWIPRVGPSQVLNTVSELAGSPVALAPFLLLWGFGIAYCRRVWRTGEVEERWSVALVLSWMLVPMAVALFISLRKPMLVPRYFLVSAPASVLLAAVGAFEMRPRLLKISLWAAVLLSLGFVLFRYTRRNEDWRGATQYVLSQAQRGDAVVVVPGWSEPVFVYYRRMRPDVDLQPLKPSEMVTEGPADPFSNYRRLWIVTYTRDYALNEPDTRIVLRSASNHCRLLQSKEFRRLKVSLCVPLLQH